MTTEISPFQYYLGQALSGLLASRNGASFPNQETMKQIARDAAKLAQAAQQAEQDANLGDLDN